MAASNSPDNAETVSKSITDSRESKACDTSSIKGSDESFEMYCETCNRDGERGTANAFCTSCVTYLCLTCLKYHGKFLPGHTYLKEKNMPQDICTERCKTHENEIIKYFCETCDKFVCFICKAGEQHTENCKMRYLPDLIKNLDNSEDLKSLTLKKNAIETHLSETTEKIASKHDHYDKTNQEAKCAIENEKSALFEIFDQELFQIEEKIQATKAHDNDLIGGVKQQFDYLTSEIEIITNRIQNFSDCPQSQKFIPFIKLKQCSSSISELNESIERLTKQCAEKGDTPKCELTIQMNYLTQNVKQFGNKMMDNKMQHSSEDEQGPKKIVSAMDRINVKAEGDKNSCHIIDFCMMSDPYLIVCDKNNKSLKVINTRNKTIVGVRQLKTAPETATKISDTEIAVVRPYDKNEDKSTIQFLTLTKAKSLAFKKKFILTSMYCYTIVYMSDNTLLLSLSSDDKGKLQIVNMKGKVLKTIEFDDEGDIIFKCPFCMAIDGESKYAYVSDWYRDKIYELDLEKHTRKITTKDFWHPEGITTDKKEFVYVIESGTNRVHFFHPKAEVFETQVLIDKQYGDFDMSGIYYSLLDAKLYLGYADYDFIEVYKIEERADVDEVHGQIAST